MPFADLPPFVLVDASNVAFGQSNHGPAKLSNLERVIDALRAAKVSFLPWADASLRHKIDRPHDFEELMRFDFGPGRKNFVAQVEKGTDADSRMIGIARYYLEIGRPAYILTRDKFRDHPEAAGIPLIEFSLPSEEGVRFSPHLDQLLSRHAYAKRFPQLILPEDGECPHALLRAIRAGETIGVQCELCGEIDPPFPDTEEPGDESQELDQGRSLEPDYWINAPLDE